MEATARVAAADGIVVATPVYKAAYSGLLKTFLDMLPQFALRGKVVLPLATGGSIAHVLAIDYALRPVLSSLDPLHVVNGLFVLDKQITVLESGGRPVGGGRRAKAGFGHRSVLARPRTRRKRRDSELYLLGVGLG